MASTLLVVKTHGGELLFRILLKVYHVSYMV